MMIEPSYLTAAGALIAAAFVVAIAVAVMEAVSP
jgi:hypothetical protein